jgi:hypothetical protein
MTQPPVRLNGVEICHARNLLRQELQALLRGSGLEIRDRVRNLAIHNPHAPDNGRIYISYTTGDVTWQRTTWDYLGPLQGHEPDDDPDRDPPVTPTKIITTLGAQPPTP